MSNSVRILLPIFQNTRTLYFKGYISQEKQSINIYFTKYSTCKSLINKNDQENNEIFGCYSKEKSKYDSECNSYIRFEDTTRLKVKYIILNGIRIDTDDIILLLYDLDRFQSSETITCNEKIFNELQMYIKKDCNRLCNTSTYYKPIIKCPDWISCSMLAKQVINCINLASWLIKTIKAKEKMSIKQINLILAILIDIFIGYLILELSIFDKKELGISLMGALEKLVNLMYTLLTWLMGAPAGLKLNNAFNKMLGKYFLYHVHLWWLFLDISNQKLDIILNIYKYLGYLGFTFQVVIISDMISLATFHSYCIYVYAARLFNIQISGLTALLRLFVGRKYNPLRKGIDSCEYSNQELFVGTVAFTILLLLLPTTIMYYTVFTMFRVFSLLVQYILAKLVNIVQTLPCYVFMLWLTRSSKIAGNIFIEENQSYNSSHIILNVKLMNKSMQELINTFKPPVDLIKTIEWTYVVSNVFTGKNII